ncbi:MAG: glycosyltransferase family 2 protein [Pyrinomonadaceae bacterium]
MSNLALNTNDAKHERVCAVVVAYNRQALLRECLSALQAQTRSVDLILVVNNASTDGTAEMVTADFPRITLLNLKENIGGAGGFYEGMKWAYEQGYDWLWLMDDDARAMPDCLEKLLAQRRPNTGVLVPIQRDSGGRLYGISEWRKHQYDVTEEIVAQKQARSGNFVFTFVGPLIAREIVTQIGLPNKDFFIWFDDHEYALRIKSRTQAEIVAVPDAVFLHNFFGQIREVSLFGRRSTRSTQAAWKTYYGTRNQIYTLTRMGRSPRELLTYSSVQLRYLLGEAVYEPDRWERVKLRLQGVWDGIFGRLGKRVSPKK